MEQNQCYHIYNHANGNENIFREEENFRFFLQQYGKYLGDVVDTFAFCLMPNHFHLLVRVKPDLPGFQNLAGRTQLGHAANNPVTKAFSDFFNSYSKAFNKRYSRKGSLFVEHFKRKPILDDRQWQEVFLYIHLNPIKDGFVKDLNQWKFSSWNAYRFFHFQSSVNREEFKVYFDDWNHVKYLLESKRETLLKLEME